MMASLYDANQGLHWLERAWRQRHPQWDRCELRGPLYTKPGEQIWILNAGRGGIHSLGCSGGTPSAACNRAERAVTLFDKYIRFMSEVIISSAGISVELRFADPGIDPLTVRIPLTVRVPLHSRTMGGICALIERELALRALANPEPPFR